MYIRTSRNWLYSNYLRDEWFDEASGNIISTRRQRSRVIGFDYLLLSHRTVQMGHTYIRNRDSHNEPYHTLLIELMNSNQLLFNMYYVNKYTIFPSLNFVFKLFIFLCARKNYPKIKKKKPGKFVDTYDFHYFIFSL